VKTANVPDPSETRPPQGDTPRTTPGQSSKTVENTANPQLEAPTGTHGHFDTDTPGTTGHCELCGALLHCHNITSRCAECKLIARNARMSGQPADFTVHVTASEAVDNVLAALPRARVVDDRSAVR
jgi:hypothetical protein